jgi:transcriptional regulator with XRE-family HTH domain/Zn-dependent peptidase ImmA (M78 family)
MRKIFMGVRLRTLREQRRLTQAVMAQQLDISASYLNQMENNERPLTAQVLLRLQTRLGVDSHFFSEDDDARLLAQLRDVLADISGEIPLAEMQAMVQQTPALAETLVRLHRRCRNAEERVNSLANSGGDRQPGIGGSLQPHEEVRDFFYARHNYIDALDIFAEALNEKLISAPAAAGALKSSSNSHRKNSLSAAELVPLLTEYLRVTHDVRVQQTAATQHQTDISKTLLRHYDAATRVLHLAVNIEPGQQAFQLATQLALLEAGDIIAELTDNIDFSAESSRALTQIGLANYFAGALVLPYRRFLNTAEKLNYDIDLLADSFGVSYETICHRLSTLQRAYARGVPFFFIRSRRQYFEATIGHRFSFFAHRRHLSAMECLRGVRATRKNIDAIGAHAGRSHLFMGGAIGYASSRRLWHTGAHIFDRTRLRFTPCVTAGVCERIESE